jgi:hypothetical protein
LGFPLRAEAADQWIHGNAASATDGVPPAAPAPAAKPPETKARRIVLDIHARFALRHENGMSVAGLYPEEADAVIGFARVGKNWVPVSMMLAPNVGRSTIAA